MSPPSGVEADLPGSLGERGRALVRALLAALRGVPGIEGVALGGSHARGHARPDSDIDLGLYYSEVAPLDAAAVREVAAAFPGSRNPVVSEPGEWGPWVDGGAWLDIDGQRVDLLYRSLEHLARTIDDAEQGRHALHFGQQPPFGYSSATCLGELCVARVLHDPAGRVAALKARVARYPEALRRGVVQEQLWSVEFALHAFAGKFAARGEAYLTAGTLARCVHALVLVLFALNRRYLLNDKTALAEAAALPQSPADLRGRVERLLAEVGASPAELGRSVQRAQELFREVVALCDGLYAPKVDLGRSALAPTQSAADGPPRRATDAPGVKVLLVGGTSHTGKSSLAARLAAELGWSQRSTDALARHPGRPWRDDGARPPGDVVAHYGSGSDAARLDAVLDHYAHNVWPVARALVRSHVANPFDPHLVLEGSALLPEAVAAARLAGCAAVWLTASDALVRERIHESSRFAERRGAEQAWIEAFVRRAQALNAHVAEQARRLGLPCLETDTADALPELLRIARGD